MATLSLAYHNLPETAACNPPSPGTADTDRHEVGGQIGFDAAAEEFAALHSACGATRSAADGGGARLTRRAQAKAEIEVCVPFGGTGKEEIHHQRAVGASVPAASRPCTVCPRSRSSHNANGVSCVNAGWNVSAGME